MEQPIIEVEERNAFRKSAVRKLRAAGKVPGVLYGQKNDARHLSLDAHSFQLTLKQAVRGRNTLLKLKGLDREVDAIVKDFQIDPIRRHLVHVDLMEVKDADRVEVKVPITHSGRSKGQTLGGSFQLMQRTMKVSCSPMNIPTSIHIDITPLDVGANVRIGDMPLPEGVEAVGDTRLQVIYIKPPRVSAKDQNADEKKK